MNLASLLIALHVLSNLIWIGSIVAVGVLISSSAKLDASARPVMGAAARKVYRTLAAPAFGMSFLFAIALVARDPGFYFKQGWFHGKLTAALIVIALHHVIGARARKAEAGTLAGDGKAGLLTAILFVAAAAAVVFVIIRP